MKTLPANLRPRSTAPCVLLLLAEPARAAEGGLQIIPDPDTLLPLLIGFLILIPLVNRVLIQPLLRVLDAREEQIGGARQRAEEVGTRAEAIASRDAAAVSEVRAGAEAERQATLRRARADEASGLQTERAQAERQLEAARVQVGEALESARASLRQGAAGLARDAARRILGRALR